MVRNDAALIELSTPPESIRFTVKFRVYVKVAAEEIALGDTWMTAEKAIETAEAALKKGLSFEIRNRQGEVIFLTALTGMKRANEV